MKKEIILSVVMYIIIILNNPKLFAQVNEQKTNTGIEVNKYKPNVIKINPLSWIVDRFSIYYEHAFSDKIALHFGGIYLSKEITADSSGFIFKDKYTGPGILAELKYYLLDSKVAPEGLYIGANGRYQHIRWLSTFDDGILPPVKEIKYSGTIGWGAIVGYQWIFWDIIAFDLLVGFRLAYQTSTTTTIGGTGGLNFSGVYPRAGTVLGIAF